MFINDFGKIAIGTYDDGKPMYCGDIIRDTDNMEAGTAQICYDPDIFQFVAVYAKDDSIDLYDRPWQLVKRG